MIRVKNSTSSGIDWQDLRQRLANAQQAMENAGELSMEEEQKVLQERARLLARVPRQEPDSSEILEVIRFTLAGEPFAIETRYVREVTVPGAITRLPGVPEFLVGVANLRGEVTAIVDLRVFFELTHESNVRARQILVLGSNRVEFGMCVEQIDQVMQLRIDQLQPPPGSISGQMQSFLRGVTDEALLVIDGQVLLTDEQLFVDESD